jgi:hypothetical protein
MQASRQVKCMRVIVDKMQMRCSDQEHDKTTKTTDKKHKQTRQTDESIDNKMILIRDH